MGDAETLETALSAFREAIAGRGIDVLERARQLDALTMEKIRPLLGDAGKLLISPDGGLNLVPFAALVDETGHFLIENFGLSYVTSGRDLLRPVSPLPSREDPLVLGGAHFNATPQYSRGEANRSRDMQALEFGHLPGTKNEAKQIRKILGLPKNRLRIGKAANEEAVKSVRGPRILHLATHGFFLPDSSTNLQQGTNHPEYVSRRLQEAPLLRSGLALTGFNNRHKVTGANDGVLTAEEVKNLDLWGTEVVTLSACETGLGDVQNGEGVFGLRRALVLAGARTQVMSLWKVDDRATSDLMVSWYEQLNRGVPRAEAMRAVQLAALQGRHLPATNRPLARGLRNKGEADVPADPRLSGTRHPYYWASFIVSGETGPISRPRRPDSR